MGRVTIFGAQVVTRLLWIAYILTFALMHSALVGALLYNLSMIEVERLGTDERGDGATLAMQANRALGWLLESTRWQRTRERTDWIEGRLRIIQDAAARHAAVQPLEDLVRRAEDLQADGRFQEAVTLYQEALDNHSHLVPAYVGLIQAYAGLDKPQKVVEIEQQLVSLTPMVEVAQKPAAGWMLKGYDFYNEGALDFGTPLWVALYWETTEAELAYEGEQMGTWQAYSVDKVVYQFGRVSNLVFDGGLEHFTALALPISEPLNWRGRIYSTDPYQLHLLAEVERDGHLTHVIRMANVAGGPSATLSQLFPVTPGALYLQSAQVRSVPEPGRCCVAHRWEPHEMQPNPNYVTCDVSNRWETYAGLDVAPQWAEEALIVLIAQGGGQVCEYDDLFMIPIVLPRKKAQPLFQIQTENPGGR